MPAARCIVPAAAISARPRSVINVAQRPIDNLTVTGVGWH
jgi:hypothetical protein